MELHRVDCESSQPISDSYELLMRKCEKFANEIIIPAPLARSEDFIALGMEPALSCD